MVQLVVTLAAFMNTGKVQTLVYNLPVQGKIEIPQPYDICINMHITTVNNDWYSVLLSLPLPLTHAHTDEV